MTWRKRLLLSVLAVLLIGGTWFGYSVYRFLYYSMPNAYAAWQLGDIIILHLEMNGGKWPTGWEDLREAHEVCAGRSSIFSLEELRDRIDVDFAADPAKMAQAVPVGDEPPFQAIRLRDGSRSHWSGQEPNSKIWSHLNRGIHRDTPRPAPDERQTRKALVVLRAGFDLDDDGHIVRVNMGSPVGAPRYSDADLVSLKPLSRLRELLLGYSNITDEGMKTVGAFKGLRELHLYGTRVSDAGLAYLVGLRDIESLILGCPQFTDAATEHVVQMKSLKLLNLNGSQLTDAGLARLADLPGLQEVMVYTTKVTDAGAKAFHARRPGVKVSR